MENFNSRHAQKARTRKRVVDVAQALFKTYGYSAVTMRLVAEKAELSTGAIFSSFKGKEELFEAATGKTAPTSALIDIAPDMLEYMRSSASAGCATAAIILAKMGNAR